MKILRVAQTLYPDVTGGGAYHVHALSRDQAAMGHDVTVLTVRTESDQPHVEERTGYTVVRYDATARLLGNALSVGLARYLHDAASFDVIHAHSHLYASTNLAALKRRSGDTPLAITNHGLYSQTAPESIFDIYLRTIGRWTFEQADLVFCYTDVDERRLRNLGVTTDVAVVPNGVDTERFRSDGPESDLLDEDGPSILFVGRLVDGKRPQDAISAMKTVRESMPNARLFLCGDGPLRDDLERRAAADPDDATEFLGHVDYDEMPGVYRAADLLVLPSRAEGMPRTVLEARASGIPVVTTDLENVAAGADRGVRTVPVGDVDALAAAVVDGLVGGIIDERTAGVDDERAEAVDERSGEIDERPEEVDDERAEAVDERSGEVVDGLAGSLTGDLAVGAIDGGRPATTATATADAASDGGSRTVQRSTTTDAAGTLAATRRDRLDWRSTVRDTTRALETLLDETHPRQ